MVLKSLRLGGVRGRSMMLELMSFKRDNARNVMEYKIKT